MDQPNLKLAARTRNRGLSKKYKQGFVPQQIRWRAIHQFQPEESATRRFQVAAAMALAVRS
jgi:hypothetical protein